MSISISDYPVYLQGDLKLDRKCLKSQGGQQVDAKVFYKETLEISQLAKSRETIMERMKHTIVHSATSFGDMRAGILKEVREENGQYGYFDVVNACGLMRGFIPKLRNVTKKGMSSTIRQQMVHP